MHLLAYYYHWSRKEVTELPVKERVKWCKLIEKQIKAENNAVDESVNDDYS